MNDSRKKAEAKILGFMKTIDTSGKNYNFYKEKFSKMSDKEFYDLFDNNKYPIRVHTDGFDKVINLETIKNALDFIKVPYLERVNLNYIYQDEDGNAVQTNECIVGYLHISKLIQMNVKKSNHGVDISKTNPKTGELTNESKVVAHTDREFDSMAVFKLNKSIKEISTFRSDDINNYNLAYNAILSKGNLDENDLDENIKSASKKNLFVSLIGAQLDNNLF